MKSDEIYLNKLAEESIFTRCNTQSIKYDTESILLALQEISGKLSTLIALEQAAERSRILPKERQRHKSIKN